MPTTRSPRRSRHADAARLSAPRAARPPRVARQRRIAAAADLVWRHVTGADWLGLDDDDPTVGARVRLRDPFGGDGPRDGRVLAVTRGRSLSIEWWPAGRPDDRSVVCIRVDQAGIGATVTVIEEAVPALDVTTRGRVWSSCLQALAGAVETARSPFVLSVG